VLVLLLHAVCSFVAFSIAAQFARFPAAAISVSMAAVQQAPAEVTEVDQLSRIRLELATLDQISDNEKSGFLKLVGRYIGLVLLYIQRHVTP
jgi:hypothetical protein